MMQHKASNQLELYVSEHEYTGIGKRSMLSYIIYELACFFFQCSFKFVVKHGIKYVKILPEIL